ncbi:hypothetical protein [Streptomyces galbus]|uniref:Uncharacterized protein n=1 Tax=Streptomyces galbus TaxID=33898 RepID=A0A4U5W7Y5_STRGB|nr:hypothetical protein [Streptomyces galbus]TKS97101.1 hypothetical protein E4U92_33720 [Streptomyces galbus]
MSGIAPLPLVYGAWLTALPLTVANAALRSVRVRTENAVPRLATASSRPDHEERTVTTPVAR